LTILSCFSVSVCL